MKSSETYLVSIDVTDNDECVVVVTRMEGRNIKFIKKFSGEEAKELCKKLTVKE